MATETQLKARLIAQGFQFPQQILNARTIAKLGLPVGAAMLMTETGGGFNIFGHDSDALGKCPGWGWGTVTKQKYLAFRHLRDTQHRSNGVGPAQLTTPGEQDEADKAGGAWIPQHNIAVGFHLLHDLIKLYGLQDGCAAYNGGPGGMHNPGPAAYGAHVVALAEHYKAIGVGTTVGVLDP